MSQSPYDASQLPNRDETRIEVLERRRRQLMARNAALESDVKRLREYLRDHVETEDTLTENLDEARAEIKSLKMKISDWQEIAMSEREKRKAAENKASRLSISGTGLLSLHLRALSGDVAEQVVWDNAVFRFQSALLSEQDEEDF